MDQRKQPLPSTWDVNKNNILIMVSSSSKGGAQRVACQVANGLSEKYAKVIFKKIVKGIEYCHNKNICHLDIKPGNIMFDKNYQKK